MSPFDWQKLMHGVDHVFPLFQEYAAFRMAAPQKVVARQSQLASRAHAHTVSRPNPAALMASTIAQVIIIISIGTQVKHVLVFKCFSERQQTFLEHARPTFLHNNLPLSRQA